jgi:hypothetical protein
LHIETDLKRFEKFDDATCQPSELATMAKKRKKVNR